MTYGVLIVFIIAIAIAVTACGDDSVSDRRTAAAKTARGLTQQLNELQRSVREALAHLQGTADERAQARGALADAEGRARAVAREARSRLGEDDPARKQLEQAANRLAEAAAMPPGKSEEAQQALDDARDHLGKSVEAIDDRLPADARSSLEKLWRSRGA